MLKSLKAEPLSMKLKQENLKNYGLHKCYNINSSVEDLAFAKGRSIQEM